MTSFVSYRLKNETRWSACFYAYLCAGNGHLPTSPSLPTYSLPNWILSWKKFNYSQKSFCENLLFYLQPLSLSTHSPILCLVWYSICAAMTGVMGDLPLMWYSICAAMTGVMGDLKESRELFLQSSRLVKRKNNNLEKFCYRRVSGHIASCNRVSRA